MSLEERWGYVGDDVAANIMLEGLRPKFHTSPPRSLDPPPEALTSPFQVKSLLEFIPGWLTRGIVREVTGRTPLFFSRMFTVLKKNGKKRPILDLSRLNKLISTPQFRMETLEKIVKQITFRMWGTSVDITDAYLHVPIPLEFQIYFAFRLGLRTYVFQVMPFGLTTAPWGFSRVVKPIVFSASSGSNDFLLSGRLSDSCFVVPFSKDSYQMDIGCPGMAGVHSEPREVVSCPSPETGVSGHYV